MQLLATFAGVVIEDCDRIEDLGGLELADQGLTGIACTENQHTSGVALTRADLQQYARKHAHRAEGQQRKEKVLHHHCEEPFGSGNRDDRHRENPTADDHRLRRRYEGVQTGVAPHAAVDPEQPADRELEAENR